MHESKSTLSNTLKFQTIWSLFEAQSQQTPNALALSDELVQLKYGQVYEQAILLAQHILAKLSIDTQTTEPVIVLFLKNNASLVIAILAIMRINAAYLILDTDYPKERLEYCIQDSGANLIITDHANQANFFDANKCLCIEDSYQLHTSPALLLDHDISAHRLAYLVYTSGTTGQPKGILIENHSLTNVILHFKQALKHLNKY